MPLHPVREWKRLVATLPTVNASRGAYSRLQFEDVVLDEEVLDIMLIKVSPSQTLCVEECNNGVKFGERCHEVNSTLEVLRIVSDRFEFKYSAIALANIVIDHHS